MKISERLQNVLREEGEKLSHSPEFIELQEFYSDMKSKNLVVKSQYNLPPLDTIGRTIYHKGYSQSSHRSAITFQRQVF